MIRFYKERNGDVIMHVDTRTAGRIGSALIQARPQGSVSIEVDGVNLHLHVHGKQSEAVDVHRPVNEL